MFLAEDLHNQWEETREGQGVPNKTGDRKPIEKAVEVIQAKDNGLESRVVARCVGGQKCEGQDVFVDCIQKVKERESVVNQEYGDTTDREIRREPFGFRQVKLEVT